MDKNSKIYVAGHRGLVGSAIWNNLISKGYTNLIGRTHAELDLLDGTAVKHFFDTELPETSLEEDLESDEDFDNIFDESALFDDDFDDE